MSNLELIAVSRPDPATLQAAISRLNEGFDVHTPEQMLEAGLIVVGEACSQLDNEKKSTAQVVASLGEHGLPQERAEPWVEKAQEVVHSGINQDPGQSPHERAGSTIPVSAIVFVVVTAVMIYFLWPR